MAASRWDRIREFVVEVATEIDRDRVPGMAAGVAFYVTLALFPTLTVLVSLYGLFSDPADVRGQLESLTFLPSEVRSILDEQMLALTQAERPTLGIGLAVSVTFALWAASGGMHALIDAISLAYCDKETRSWVRVRALSLAMMIGLLVFAIIGVGLIAGVPVMLERFGFYEGAQVIQVLRWPGLAVGVMGAIGFLYRLAPCRERPPWRRIVSLGSVLATIGWMAATFGFSIYVSNFGNYNGTYGALGGVIVLLTWLWITSMVILGGAEVDAVLEARRKAGKKKAAGPSKPTPPAGSLPDLTSPGSPSPT